MRIANPGGLGTSPELDVNDPLSTERILDEKITLYQVFEIASKYDAICSEWTNNYTITFDLAYPILTQAIAGSQDLETAIIQTFLKVLAKHPDTFIARKTNIEKARSIRFCLPSRFIV